MFGEHADAIEDFIRINALELDDAAHLKAIFDHYNARVATN